MPLSTYVETTRHYRADKSGGRDFAAASRTDGASIATLALVFRPHGVLERQKVVASLTRREVADLRDVVQAVLRDWNLEHLGTEEGPL